ncbi:MAG: FAD:protein FMN transferase, partial [Lachnospiraceae bacterium]|nr:FAD:protein FMN transferase [Lachnospiraceae bacterium]
HTGYSRQNLVNKMNVLRKLTAFIIIISILPALCGCSKEAVSPVKRSGFYFDTLVSITLYDGDAGLIDECFELCDHYEKLFSKTIDSSDISRINAASGGKTEVSADTISLIETALKYHVLSDGAYDITIKPVIDLWGFEDLSGKTEHHLPDKDALSDALSHVSSDNILINKTDNTVTLTDPLSSIDMGSVAKGYIADRLKEFLLSRNVSSAVIDLGGNITLINGKPSGTGFTDFHIGIKDPTEPSGSETALALSVKDTSVVTSGIYERYLLIDGKKYHHIIDKRTGYPTDNDLLSVTVITSSSADADALSTVCLLCGEEKALRIINSLSDTEAVFIKKDDTISCSDGAEKYYLR